MKKNNNKSDIETGKLKQAETELRLYTQILEHIEEGVFLIRASDEAIVFSNHKFEHILGYGTGEFVGKHFSFIYVPFEKNTSDTTLEIIQSLNINGTWQGEVQNLRKDGTLCWCYAHLSTFEHPQHGKAWLAVHQDISALKQAEQARKVNEEKYKIILNSSPDGVFLIDLNGIITEVSEIGLELFGADNKDDLVGRDFFRFVPPDEQNTIKEIIEKTTNEGLVQNVKLKLRKKNQSLFASETSATLIQGPDGSPIAFMIIIRDISYRQKMETKHIHADRMANLGEMASGIAHEINQPLNIISLVMDNILYEATVAENIGKDYLKRKTDKIFENITRIRNIIDHVRAFSRSNDDYILTGFDINASIISAVAMISEQLKHLAISLTLQLDENLPLITGNTVKFEQVIINLLSNAKDAVLERKSMQPTGYEMFIAIKSYQQEQNLFVEVTDNGTGISKDDIEHIMLPFYTTKVAGKGTGLGLSISYQIVKEMNGTIEIAGNRFNGTTFKIILKIPEKEKATE